MHERYRGKKYLWRKKGKQRKIVIIDITLGGDVVYREWRYNTGQTMVQLDFLSFLKNAKELQ